jgi:hypothetical protein
MVILYVIARTLTLRKGGKSLVLLPSLLIGSILLDLPLPLYGLDISPLAPCQVQCKSTREPDISSSPLKGEMGQGLTKQQQQVQSRHKSMSP